MYCPQCGQPLTKIQRDPDAELQERLRAWAEWASDTGKEAPPQVRDDSEHWYCTNGSCVIGNDVGDEEDNLIILNVHQPYKGPHSRPGDSWSISFIK